MIDGTLQGVCAKEDDHGPAVFAPLEGRDLTLSYKVKLDEKGNCLAQDRGTPQSHLEAGKLRAALAKEGKKLPPPSADQLADPKFYRTEKLANVPMQAKPGEWIKSMSCSKATTLR